MPTIEPMRPAVHKLNPIERQREKEASRKADARALASGRKSREQLRKENGAFSAIKLRINLDGAKALS